MVKAYARKAGKVGYAVAIRTIQTRRQVIQRFSSANVTIMT
jgi:hypothetical protein